MADISKINPNGTEYNLKDATARAGIESSKTLKSSVVTVPDAAPINAEDITVDITPQQDLHGYDRPWAGGAGKNKLPMTVEGIKAANTEGTWSGNVYTVYNVAITILTDSANNVLGLKFLGTASHYFYFNVNSNYTIDGTYIISPLPQGASYSNAFYGRLYYTDGTDTGFLSREVTVTKQNAVGRMQIVVSTNASVDFTYQPMIRLSTETDSTFAPYSNDCPIEGWTGAELDRVGKNLFDKDNAVLNKTVKSSDGTEKTDTNYFCSDYIEVKPNNTYYLCKVFGINWANAGCLYDKYKNFIKSFTVTGTTATSEGAYAITDSNAKYMRINGAMSDIDSAYVIFGSTATTYEPYQGISRTVNFGETVYGGKWHVTECGADKTHGYVDLGDCDWAIQSIDGNNCFRTTLQNKTFTENAICSQYSYSLRCSTDGTFSTGLGAAASLYVRDSRYSDTTAFKTAMSGVQLVYELATPTTISTPKQNVPMLQGINTVFADCGDTQLKYQPDNVVGELKGEIRAVEAELAEVEANLEIVYEDHVANTSMGIIVDGYSVGDMPFSNALDIAKTGYTPISVTDTSIVHSTVANQGEIATHCLLDVTNNRVRFYVHVMDSAASLTIPPNSLTFRVAYKKA